MHSLPVTTLLYSSSGYQLICGYFRTVQRVVMFHPHELAPKRFVTVTELDVMEMTKLLEMRKED